MYIQREKVSFNWNAAFNLDFKGSDERRSIISLDYVDVKGCLSQKKLFFKVHFTSHFLSKYERNHSCHFTLLVVHNSYIDTPPRKLYFKIKIMNSQHMRKFGNLIYIYS